LKGLGVKFLRFTDEDVKKNIEGVVLTIEKWIREHQPTPAPLPRGDLKMDKL
jgi:very-short-patch-repair endonuclease